MKSDLDRHIERHLKDGEFRIYFDRADAKRRIAQEIAALRKSRNITQTQLAKEVKTNMFFSASRGSLVIVMGVL